MPKEIGTIDLDEVVVNAGPVIVRSYNERHGTEVQLEHLYDFNSAIVWGVPDAETVLRRVVGFYLEGVMDEAQPVDGSLEGLELLGEEYELDGLTSRPSVTSQATQRWIERFCPGVFRNVWHADSINAAGITKAGKGAVCISLGAKFHVDDHPGHVASVQAVGTTGVLFGEYPWNRVDTLPDGALRAANWSEVTRLVLREYDRS